ncbi:MAG TPA: ATP-dependent RecD-like DNA helicase [Polyangiaceae bacterium]|nr:ATP-dependent RecD-like DNA helicase [Polyangiaceae bacterium]
MTSLIGDVRRVTFENEETGFRVLKVDVEDPAEEVSVVGVLPAVGPGTRVRLTGQFVFDKRHGKQFQAESLVPVEPETVAGIERYLSSGLIPGIGAGFAKRIVARFGTTTLEILDANADRLNEVPGLGAKRVAEIKKHWVEHRMLSTVIMLLQPHGGTIFVARRIVDRYGARAAEMVQGSPYRLALEVRGVGFKTADRIARSFGIAGDHPERAQAGVMHTLDEITDQGHTYCERNALVEKAAQLLAVDAVHPNTAIDALWASERVVIEEGRVYPARLHRAEHNVAQALGALSQGPLNSLGDAEQLIAAYESQSALKLSASQRQAVRAAIDHKITVITGGPGVGKTTIVSAIVKIFSGKSQSILLGAPTGRAAKRLSEATGQPAATLHRVLEYEPRMRQFQRDGSHPLTADLVIVDEASMIDILLAEALLSAIPASGRLLVVGDADQLPSVSAGAFLRDLIQSGAVHTVRLGEIFRQDGASQIVKSAHSILHGEEPRSGRKDEAKADFFVIARSDGLHAQKTIVELVKQNIPEKFGFSPRDAIQVLTPMHRGPVGTMALNQALQAVLNPTGVALERRGMTFRVGDKLLQTKNDYDREIHNGDIGIIERIDPAEQQLWVRFDDRLVELDDAALDQVTLAYAISIHKSQGSEYPAVVVPLLTSHFVMLSRNLLYTAVTRAKKLCVLVADPKAIALALAETRREERQTGLAERINRALEAALV